MKKLNKKPDTQILSAGLFPIIFPVIFLTMIMLACSDLKKQTFVDKELAGKHLLQKLNPTTEIHTSSHSSFFLVWGSSSSYSEKELGIYFSWQAPDSAFVISFLPLHKVRIKLDSLIVNPYVEFNWDNGSMRTKDMQHIMDWDVNYAKITCRPEDFPKDLRINQILK